MDLTDPRKEGKAADAHISLLPLIPTLACRAVALRRRAKRVVNLFWGGIVTLVCNRRVSIVVPMNKEALLGYLERLDQALKREATLHIYGSAAFMLLDEPERTSLDVDVAAPYSTADVGDLRQAAAAAGLPLNPPDDYPSDHLEWISAVRLCLAKPNPETDLLLWKGERLSVKTGSITQLIASKLIRYDEIDRSDIQYLCRQSSVDFIAVAEAVTGLPAPFNCDALVLENLENLKVDMTLWKGDSR